VLGGHGDTMVPLTRYSPSRPFRCGSGQDGRDLAGRGSTRSSIAPEWRREIVNLLRPVGVLRPRRRIAMAESYLEGQERVAGLRRHLNGEYGVKDMYVGVPVVIGSRMSSALSRSIWPARIARPSTIGRRGSGLIDACKKIAPDARSLIGFS